jgi:trans-aconitate 2-methyltransferase
MSELGSNSAESASEKSWNASAYDSGHSFVWKYGEEVLELLAPRPGERVLDLGCGTGHLTNQIAARGALAVGLDKSPEMIERARTLYPKLRFEIGDATGFEFSEPFDAVFSNAAIHWMKDQDAVAVSILRVLRIGGRFVAEFGGKGNIRKLRTALHNALEAGRYMWNREAARRYYPSVGEYATLLESHRFRVTYAAHIDRPTELEGGESGLRKWLEVFADNELRSVPEPERGELIHRVERELRPELFRDGSWFADYKRLRVVAVKE